MVVKPPNFVGSLVTQAWIEDFKDEHFYTVFSLLLKCCVLVSEKSEAEEESAL